MEIFDLSIYREDAVRRAVQDYTSIAVIRCIKEETSIKCELIKSEYDKELTMHEFSNYVLALTVTMDGMAE